jgi:hypothetical protein
MHRLTPESCACVLFPKLFHRVCAYSMHPSPGRPDALLASAGAPATRHLYIDHQRVTTSDSTPPVPF